jgi:hypothetical protein
MNTDYCVLLVQVLSVNIGHNHFLSIMSHLVDVHLTLLDFNT